jgi:glycosyltransferase involved in cell wall biosynthesis
MKVLFVYKYLTPGGVEAVLRARLLGLPALGVEAHAWFFHEHGGGSAFVDLAGRAHVGTPAACLAFALAERFDLVSTIDSDEVMAGLGRPDAPPWLLECHSAYVENLDYLQRLPSRAPRAVLVPSAAQRELLRGRLPEALEVRVVPNPLTAGFVAPLRPSTVQPPRPVLAWLGRLDELKNWRGFLQIGRRLLDRGVGAELWLAGNPVSEDGAEALQREARRIGVLPALRWLRGLPPDRVPALLDLVRASGGLVISTSARESFGLSVVEAMARACAVLVPDQPPFSEYVLAAESRYRPGAMDSACEAAAHLLASPSLRQRLALEGREIALARFAPDVAIGSLARELHALFPTRDA